jgi:cell division septation protein DedD
MNRLLSILVTLFILFLVYLWIHHLMGSSKRKVETGEEENAIDSTEAMYTDTSTYVIEDDDVPQEFVDTPTEAEPDHVAVEQPPAETKAPEPEKKTVTPSTPPPPQNPAPTSTTRNTTSADAGMHLVIAGNFLTRANAEERVKELKKIGYSKAEVVNFELSEYHTACAGRYTDLDEARRVAKKIKDLNGIDTYVRHGN